MKVWYQGRLVESYQTPRRNRSRYKIWFKWESSPGKISTMGWEKSVVDRELHRGIKELVQKWKNANPQIRLINDPEQDVEYLGADIDGARNE